MTIFAILMPTPQAKLVDTIASVFPDNHLSITDTQWLVSSTGTIIEVTAKLGIYDPKNPSIPSTGNAVVIAIASYSGRAPQTVWDWIRAKLEPPRV